MNELDNLNELVQELIDNQEGIQQLLNSKMMLKKDREYIKNTLEMFEIMIVRYATVLEAIQKENKSLVFFTHI